MLERQNAMEQSEQEKRICWNFGNVLLRNKRCKIQKQSLRGVVENSCSEISSQNPSKVPLKKLIVCKVAVTRAQTC